MIGFLADEPTPARVVVVLAAVVVFLGFFFHGIRGRMVPKPPALVARAYLVTLAIAAALTIADRPDWSLLFYYVIALAGTRLPRPWSVICVVLTAAVAAVSSVIGDAEHSTTAGVGLGLLGIGAAMVVMGELMRSNRELHEARAELARLAVADERARFARDLHDLLGHSLSVIALKAQLARRRLPDDPQTAAADVADIEDVTREALREVRQAVSGYRRPQLDAELDGARTALDAAGIATTIERPPVDLPAEVEAALAWTVREAGGRLEAGPREDGPGFLVRAIVPIGSLQ